MNKKVNIVLAGVGGQGVVTAAYLLGKACLNGKVNVFTSEVHGMAQRGGSVSCTVRMGDVSGPLVPAGCADVLLSTEPLETLRYILYVNKKTKIITDIHPVIPFTVAVGGETYPSLEEIFAELRTRGELYTIDALQIAEDVGAVITRNIVLLGALAGSEVLPFPSEVLLETILENVPEKYKSVNRNAFTRGLNAFKNCESK